MNKLKLFLSALCQVGLVSVNIYQISHKYYLGAFIVGFLISLFWSFNIKGIAFGNKMDRLIYCLGAAIGTLCGMLLSTLLYNQI